MAADRALRGVDADCPRQHQAGGVTREYRAQPALCAPRAGQLRLAAPPGQAPAHDLAHLSALKPYQNLDGGFGQILEPDFRGALSQPLCIDQALRVLDELPRHRVLLAGCRAAAQPPRGASERLVALELRSLGRLKRTGTVGEHERVAHAERTIRLNGRGLVDYAGIVEQ